MERSLVLDLPEAGDAISELQVHSVLDEIPLHQTRHLRVEGRHDLVELLDERDFEPGVGQVLDHLQADEAATTTTARFGFVTTWKPVYVSIPVFTSSPRFSHWRMVRVGDGAHREDARQVDAGQRRSDGRRAG